MSIFASDPADKAIFIASIASHQLQMSVLNYVKGDCNDFTSNDALNSALQMENFFMNTNKWNYNMSPFYRT
jgi:hypothetical protein